MNTNRPDAVADSAADVQSCRGCGDSDLGTGYAHRSYAESFSQFGDAKYLPRCQGWIIERSIGDTGYRDGMGVIRCFAVATLVI